MNSTSNKALPARLNDIDLGDAEYELRAFYAGLRGSGKGPSKEHFCA